MSHSGRAGPPDITGTYSLLVVNVTFRTTADDLFPYFDKYGKVVDLFIPRNRSHKGRVREPVSRIRGRSRSCSPQLRYREDYYKDRDRDYYRRRSRSWDRYDHDRYHGRHRDYRHRSRSSSASLDYDRDCGRGWYHDE